MTAAASDPRPPRVGVIGGGQLARMMAPAAARLGVNLRVLAETADASAAQVIADTTVGDYTDLPTLQAFAAECDVVTFDHEHVPTDHLHVLEAAGVAVRPGPDALVYAQDKLAMRVRLAALGAPIPPYAAIETAADIERFAAAHGWPVVLKTPRGGYDGKGVWLVRAAAAAAEVLTEVPVRPLLAERYVPFTRELAAQVARSPIGQAVAYPVVETVQRDGICVEVTAPAPGLPERVAVRAQEVALKIANELGVAGMLAVEMFEVPAAEGGDPGIVVNELAMRPHNSGHWSIDGAVTDQFEQHLRAVLDLPLGDPRARVRETVMVNVLGGSRAALWTAYPHVLARDAALRVHLYGKSVRPGRKVGHVTVTSRGREPLAALQERARHAADYVASAAPDETDTGPASTDSATGE